MKKAFESLRSLEHIGEIGELVKEVVVYPHNVTIEDYDSDQSIEFKIGLVKRQRFPLYSEFFHDMILQKEYFEWCIDKNGLKEHKYRFWIDEKQAKKVASGPFCA